MSQSRAVAQPLTDEQRMLVEENLNCVKWFLGQHKGFGKYLGYDDAFQIGCLGLMKAAQNWDPARGSFGTIAILEVHHALALAMRYNGASKRIPPHGIISLDYQGGDAGNDGNNKSLRESVPDTAPTPEEAYELKVMRKKAHEILAKDKLLREYYEGQKTQRDLALEAKNTQSWVSRLIKRKIQAARQQLEIC